MAAYQFDAAVATFGTIIENGTREMIETGSGRNKRWKPRWSLNELLSDDFKFPREDDFGELRTIEGFEEVG